jgi:hypothetical protein
MTAYEVGLRKAKEGKTMNAGPKTARYRKFWELADR